MVVDWSSFIDSPAADDDVLACTSGVVDVVGGGGDAGDICSGSSSTERKWLRTDGFTFNGYKLILQNGIQINPNIFAFSNS